MSEEKKNRDDLLTRIAELQETIRIATRNRTPLNYGEGQDARNLLSDIAALFPNPDETENGQASLDGCLNILDEIEVGSFNSDDIQTIRNAILYLQRENIMLKENLARVQKHLQFAVYDPGGSR